MHYYDQINNKKRRSSSIIYIYIYIYKISFFFLSVFISCYEYFEENVGSSLPRMSRGQSRRATLCVRRVSTLWCQTELLKECVLKWWFCRAVGSKIFGRWLCISMYMRPVLVVFVVFYLWHVISCVRSAPWQRCSIEAVQWNAYHLMGNNIDSTVLRCVASMGNNCSL